MTDTPDSDKPDADKTDPGNPDPGKPDPDKKDFKPFDEEQRRKLEEQVKEAMRARRAQAEAKTDDSKVAEKTQLRSAESTSEAESGKSAQTPIASSPAEADLESNAPDSMEIEALKNRPGFHAISDDDRSNIEKLVAEKLKKKERLDALRKHLLSMAGKQVQLDEDNPFNKLIMQKGQAWNSFDVNLIAGPEMTTHRSVARLWETNLDIFKIAVGYALDAAGTWRSHAWLVVKGEVNEVKMKYAVYYGVPLSKAESIRFIEWVRSGK